MSNMLLPHNFLFLLQVVDVYATAHKYNIKSVMKSCSKYTEKFAYDTTGVSTLKSPVFWIKEAAKYEVHHF